MIVRRLPWAFRRGRIVGYRKVTGWTPNRGNGWWHRKFSVPRYERGFEALTLFEMRTRTSRKRSAMARQMKMSPVHYARLESGELVLPKAQWAKAILLAGRDQVTSK